MKIRRLGCLAFTNKNPFASATQIHFTTQQMNVICPKCQRRIALEDVNVSTDLALCRSCQQTYAFSELVESQPSPSVNLNQPPGGAWLRRDMNSFEVGATTRSASAIFLVPFMCVWSGFSLGGIYGTQIINGKFNLMMSLFGIPFVLGTLLFGSLAAMSVCGKITVQVSGKQGTIFTGIGPIGFRRRFEWDGITAIRRTEHTGNRGAVSNQITFEGRKQINFGSGLKTERLEFMLNALRCLRWPQR